MRRCLAFPSRSPFLQPIFPQSGGAWLQELLLSAFQRVGVQVQRLPPPALSPDFGRRHLVLARRNTSSAAAAGVEWLHTSRYGRAAEVRLEALAGGGDGAEKAGQRRLLVFRTVRRERDVVLDSMAGAARRARETAGQDGRMPEEGSVGGADPASLAQEYRRFHAYWDSRCGYQPPAPLPARDDAGPGQTPGAAAGVAGMAVPAWELREPVACCVTATWEALLARPALRHVIRRVLQLLLPDDLDARITQAAEAAVASAPPRLPPGPPLNGARASPRP